MIKDQINDGKYLKNLKIVENTRKLKIVSIFRKGFCIYIYIREKVNKEENKGTPVWNGFKPSRKRIKEKKE